MYQYGSKLIVHRVTNGTEMSCFFTIYYINQYKYHYFERQFINNHILYTPMHLTVLIFLNFPVYYLYRMNYAKPSER